ncbi:hypothetical protein PFISCL1PPCAC_18423, partial [Pristionchus fissidentatus]
VLVCLPLVIWCLGKDESRAAANISNLLIPLNTNWTRSEGNYSTPQIRSSNPRTEANYSNDIIRSRIWNRTRRDAQNATKADEYSNLSEGELKTKLDSAEKAIEDGNKRVIECEGELITAQETARNRKEAYEKEKARCEELDEIAWQKQEQSDNLRTARQEFNNAQRQLNRTRDKVAALELDVVRAAPWWEGAKFEKFNFELEIARMESNLKNNKITVGWMEGNMTIKEQKADDDKVAFEEKRDSLEDAKKQTGIDKSELERAQEEYNKAEIKKKESSRELERATNTISKYKSDKAALPFLQDLMNAMPEYLDARKKFKPKEAALKRAERTSTT